MEVETNSEGEELIVLANLFSFFSLYFYEPLSLLNPCHSFKSDFIQTML